MKSLNLRMTVNNVFFRARYRYVRFLSGRQFLVNVLENNIPVQCCGAATFLGGSGLTLEQGFSFLLA